MITKLKTNVLTLMLLLCTTTELLAQEKFDYCQIRGESNINGSKVNVTVDFGKDLKWFANTSLKDSPAKDMKFSSMIDALNYMSREGWEIFQAYATTEGSLTGYYFLLRKKE